MCGGIDEFVLATPEPRVQDGRVTLADLRLGRIGLSELARLAERAVSLPSEVGISKRLWIRSRFQLHSQSMPLHKTNFIDTALARLAELITQGRFEDLETERLEIKPIPPSTGEWTERYKSVNAFMNTQGGVIILGIREEGKGSERRYVLGSWGDVEDKIKELPRKFCDRRGNQVFLEDCFPSTQIRDFLDGRIYVIYVDELSADRKFVFYKNAAYKRVLRGDHKLTDAEIERQEEFKEEAQYARELNFVPELTIQDIDLDRLNEYINALNRPTRIETIKSDLEAARPFLERKSFLKQDAVTTLGVLVCGKYPADRLGFRCQVHCYVDVKDEIARDKQDLADNILPLMENSYAYLLRNIHVGISIEQGGTSRQQYPDALLRETVNNALAHRDYSLNRQVILAIKPGEHIAIRNPGSFRKHLLIEHDGTEDTSAPVLRILPESRPRNPKLADVLRVYRKWEGRGIGMATLVDLSLQNQIDLPYYQLHQDEVALHLQAGQLLDERMERLFQAYDGYLERKLKGRTLTEPQKLVLSYIIKSEWANELSRYSVLLTADNNHWKELTELKRLDLITIHPKSQQLYPIYIADRQLMKREYRQEIRDLFGPSPVVFDNLDLLSQDILSQVYRFQHFSKSKGASARQVSMTLWSVLHGNYSTIKDYEDFYRKVRSIFLKLEKKDLLMRLEGTRSYVLNSTYHQLDLPYPLNQPTMVPPSAKKSS